MTALSFARITRDRYYAQRDGHHYEIVTDGLHGWQVLYATGDDYDAGGELTEIVTRTRLKDAKEQAAAHFAEVVQA